MNQKSKIHLFRIDMYIINMVRVIHGLIFFLLVYITNYFYTKYTVNVELIFIVNCLLNLFTGIELKFMHDYLYIFKNNSV